MKQLFFIFLLFLVVQTAAGQKFEKRYAIEVMSGPSFPAGKFSDRSPDDLMSHTAVPGLAKTGEAIQAAISYRIKSFLGVSIVINGQQNKQDESSLNELFRKNDYYHNIYTTKTKNWKIGRALAGGNWIIPFSAGNTFMLRLTLLAGALKTSFPGYSYSVINVNNGGSTGYGSSNPGNILQKWAFCYQAASAIEWNCKKNLYITAEADYSDAVLSNTYNFYSNYASPDKPVKYAVASINILAGVGYRF